MNKLFTILFILLPYLGFSQYCEKLIEFIKVQNVGVTYYSTDDNTIANVTFYYVDRAYDRDHFALVCVYDDHFDCNEYLYQVSPLTEYIYKGEYKLDAYKAFIEFIHKPFKDNLKCSFSNKKT